MIGVNAIEVRKDRPTMNLALNPCSPKYEIDGIVLHEFGHAIGFIHEHQRVDSDLEFDAPKLYEYYYDLAGWSEAVVDDQIISRVHVAVPVGTAYDNQSIMMYPIVKSALITGDAPGWRDRLSPLDKVAARAAYPM